jgi:hypothetical protein
VKFGPFFSSRGVPFSKQYFCDPDRPRDLAGSGFAYESRAKHPVRLDGKAKSKNGFGVLPSPDVAAREHTPDGRPKHAQYRYRFLWFRPMMPPGAAA